MVPRITNINRASAEYSTQYFQRYVLVVLQNIQYFQQHLQVVPKNTQYFKGQYWWYWSVLPVYQIRLVLDISASRYCPAAAIATFQVLCCIRIKVPPSVCLAPLLRTAQRILGSRYTLQRMCGVPRNAKAGNHELGFHDTSINSTPSIYALFRHLFVPGFRKPCHITIFIVYK